MSWKNELPRSVARSPALSSVRFPVGTHEPSARQPGHELDVIAEAARSYSPVIWQWSVAGEVARTATCARAPALPRSSAAADATPRPLARRMRTPGARREHAARSLKLPRHQSTRGCSERGLLRAFERGGSPLVAVCSHRRMRSGARPIATLRRHHRVSGRTNKLTSRSPNARMVPPRWHRPRVRQRLSPPRRAVRRSRIASARSAPRTVAALPSRRRTGSRGLPQTSPENAR